MQVIPCTPPTRFRKLHSTIRSSLVVVEAARTSQMLVYSTGTVTRNLWKEKTKVTSSRKKNA